MGTNKKMNSFASVRIAAITGGMNVPSARFRIRSLIHRLKYHGIDVDEFIPKINKYPPNENNLRPLWFLKALQERVPIVFETYKYDITLFQRELISTFLTLEPLASKPIILDVDDAIFLNQRGFLVKYFARLCDLIICGNSFLAEWFANYNSNIVIIPTGVDVNKYCPADRRKNNQKIIIGWIGTSGNLKYIYNIESSLYEICKQFPNVRIKIISDIPPQFRKLSSEKIEFILWTKNNEVKDIQSLDIGIMPLDDSLWARGKCSFKMLQYMSCSVPVVASPVGMNTEVLSNGLAGYLAESNNDWFFSLEELITKLERRKKMGAVGRSIVKEHYSLEVVSNLFANSVLKLVE